MKTLKNLCGPLMLAALALVPALAGAETISRVTTTSQVEIPNTQKVDFKVFDLNHDGILSRREVGEELFYLFDQDGNQVLDNHEYERKTVLTVIPMRSETKAMYDFDDDGKVDATRFTCDSFSEQSGLARFVKTPGGLSPREFTGRTFNDLDVDKDHVISMAEWKGAYNRAIDARNRELARVNQ